MPIYRVEVSKVLVATVFVEAGDEEEAASEALSYPPEDEQYDTEDISVLSAEEIHDTSNITAFVHNDAEGRIVRDFEGHPEEDFEI
jgi:hypothetical protein